MSKFAGLLVAVGLMIVTGCPSTPKTDPDNGVSNTSYRQAIGRCESNTAAIVSRMTNAKAAALADPSVARSADWWDAQITELQLTRDEAHNTLLGSTK